MSRKVLGCSPDMAARIVNLLMVDIGIRLEPRQIVKAEPPATEPIKLHRNTKVTPDVATWIQPGLQDLESSEGASFVCPNCCEAECAAVQGTHWLACPGCGRAYDEDDLADYYDRKEDKQLARDIKACWDEQERISREPGGGDDGLAMTWDVAINEANSVNVSTKVEIIDGRKVVRVKGLDKPSKVVHAAIDRLLGRKHKR